MADDGHPITFGLSLYPSVDGLGEARQLAQAADAAGLEYLAIQDHAYNPEFLDVWTLITYLAAETERISFVPDVADLQLRPPTILAKAAASLSVLSGGRIVLGVGGGASAGGIAAMGGTRRSGPEMVAFTDEALQIMRRALAGGVVDRPRPRGRASHLQRGRCDRYRAGPRTDRGRAVVDRYAGRLVGRSWTRHVHLLAHDRTIGTIGGVRQGGRPGCAAARERPS